MSSSGFLINFYELHSFKVKFSRVARLSVCVVIKKLGPSCRGLNYRLIIFLIVIQNLVSALSSQSELRTTASPLELSTCSPFLAGRKTKCGYHATLICNRTRAVKFEVPRFAENLYGFIPENDKLLPNLLPPSHSSPMFPYPVREGSNAFWITFLTCNIHIYIIGTTH